MTDTITAAEREAIDAAPVRKVKAGRARGVNKRTAPMTMTKPTRAQRGKVKATRSTRKSKATKTGIANNKHNTDMKGIVTTVQIAAEQGVNPKTLRARIRRNMEAWEPLFKDGIKHMFPDNKTTRAKIDALLA